MTAAATATTATVDAATITPLQYLRALLDANATPSAIFRLEAAARRVRCRARAADLREPGRAGRRGVVPEGREAAVVGRAEPAERDVLGRLQHAVANLFRRLDVRVDRIRDTDEDLLVGLCVLSDRRQRLRTIAFTRQLDIETSDLELEQRRQEVRVVDVGAVRRVLVSPRAGMHADALTFLGREPLEHRVVECDEVMEDLTGRIQLEREPALVKSIWTA